MKYLAMILLCMLVFFLLKNRFFDTTDYRALLSNGAIIVDVRSPSEFSTGYIENSLNIPVGELTNKLEYFKGKNQTIITCCASGMRSGQATSIAKSRGINAYNGGDWNNLNRKLNK